MPKDREELSGYYADTKDKDIEKILNTLMDDKTCINVFKKLFPQLARVTNKGSIFERERLNNPRSFILDIIY